MTLARLAGRVAGGSTGPVCSFLGRGTVWCWSGGLRQGGDPVPGGHDGVGPGPGSRDLEAAPAGAADQPAGGVQDAVTSLN